MMKYRIYKLKFKAPVHFGQQSLEKSGNVFMADTLFSALFIEAVKSENNMAEKFYNLVYYDKLIFSDALPYIDKELYVPKPIMRLEYTSEGDSKIKKAFKKLNYLPINRLTDYINGRLDADDINMNFEKKFGAYEMRTVAAVHGLEESVPYHVQSFRYNKNSGLYVIVGYESDEADEIFDELIFSLGYNGIGGERSSGYGRFEARVSDITDELIDRLQNKYDKYMNLSIALPADVELDKSICESEYSLIKRSGFTDVSVSNNDTKRKKDIFMFKAGSTFKNTFAGNIFNVASDNVQPVYRYGKAMWLGVR